MSKIFVMPVADRFVRKPDGSELNAAGELVDRDPCWVRRQRAGDIRFSKPPAQAGARTAKKVNP